MSNDIEAATAPTRGAHSVLRRRLITVGLLLAAGGTALLGIPGLHDAARRASSVSPVWLLAAVAF